MKPATLQRILILAGVMLLAGCTPGMRQSWIDFKAYYNTFYNAGNYFDAGLEAQILELAPLNPERPVRIHQSPSGVGTEDFIRAIDTATEIITDHTDSRYYWPAYSIIGRSHFYTENYFTALEIFITIYEGSGDSRVKGDAALWEGRCYLEMGVVEDGVRILYEKLTTGQISEPGHAAEIRLVLADLHVAGNNYELAIDFLREGLPDVSDPARRALGFFLLGQLFQFTGNGSEAIEAYRSVLGNRPNFELEYQARRKIGEVYRETGNYDLAFQQFRLMERDDKFRSRLPEITYEMARTVHLRGDLPMAQSLYRTVLDDPPVRPDGVTLAKTYYSIGEVYENIQGDFSMAAAYYDSSRSQQVDAELLPIDWQPENKARTFGEFARITGQIAYRDSLLKLAMMTSEERDALIRQIRQDNRQTGEAGNSRSVLPASLNEARFDETVSMESEFGFLNVNNRVLQISESRGFRDYWGERPLTDNWRRQEAISGLRENRTAVSGNDVLPDDGIGDGDGDNRQFDLIDLTDDIPLTAEQQNSVREEIHELYFQLANLYLQNFQNSDSASVYFQKVLDSDYADHLKAQALYGLADIAFDRGNQDEISNLASQLLNDYPESAVTRRLIERLGINIGNTVTSDALQREYSDIMSTQKHPFEKAGLLYDLALASKDDSRTAQILLDAAREYLVSVTIDPVLAHVSVDSARSVLSRLDSLFPDSPENTRAEIIRDEIDAITSGPSETDISGEENDSGTVTDDSSSVPVNADTTDN